MREKMKTNRKLPMIAALTLLSAMARAENLPAISCIKGY